MNGPLLRPDQGQVSEDIQIRLSSEVDICACPGKAKLAYENPDSDLPMIVQVY
jgi:hypothetical protein